MLGNKNHRSVLNRARRRRNRNDKMKYILAAAAVLVAALLMFGISRLLTRESGPSGDMETEEMAETSAPDPAAEAQASMAAEEARRQEEEAQKQAVVDSYENLGIVLVSGYLNVRKTPSQDGDIIGKMQENSACEILGQEGDWYHISSGGVDGYISSQYVVTGEEAKALALEQVKLRAIVHVEKYLTNRTTPEQKEENIGAQALNQERYEVLDQLDGWIQIPSGYISAEYAEVRYALNEARQMDLKAMAINQYDNLLISKVANYLNIRKTPENKGDENVIGKLPGNAAGDIIETVDGWYKIRSGKVTGYVSADPQYTAVGQEAIDLAMEEASLMAIVNTDRLNVRKEPSTDSGVWTQISKEERYPVLQQMDGWVQIELDAGDEENSDAAYISTRDNNVEVRYALEEAIKFSPLEELANQQASRRTKIVNYALQFVGNPYVWGGTSLTKGADCSGFVQSVLKNYGIYLPRVSRDQAKSGRGIKSSEMRPGDLIFYANSSGTVNHVAMYIGNGQIVHAASRRSGIRISTWNYRSPKYIRNVID